MQAIPAGAANGALVTLEELGLQGCQQLLDRHLDAVARTFGSEALGVIDLPSLGSERVVADQVRVAAALYWTQEVDATGALEIVEALAEGAVSGGVIQPLSREAGRKLLSFWRDRDDRFIREERQALYARVFGPGDGAGGFDAQLMELAGALAAIDREPPELGIGQTLARANMLALELGAYLSDRSTGIVAFATRDIVAQIRLALQLLRDEDIARSLGGGSPWQIVTRYGPALLGRAVTPTRRVTRATSGMRILGWIADDAALLASGSSNLGRGHPVLRDAAAWRLATGAV